MKEQAINVEITVEGIEKLKQLIAECNEKLGEITTLADAITSSEITLCIRRKPCIGVDAKELKELPSQLAKAIKDNAINSALESFQHPMTQATKKLIDKRFLEPK